MWGPWPPVASVEILTEHHKHVPFLVKDDAVEALPNELLNWPLVPICWDLLTGLMFLESKCESLSVSRKGVAVGPSTPALTANQRKVFLVFTARA